jgi:cell division protein FtsB
MDSRRIANGVMVRVGLAVFGLATVLTLLLTLVSDRGLLAVWERGAELETLEQQIDEIEAENDSMIEEIRLLKESPEAIEERAREKLKLVRPGEVMLVLPEEEAESD